MQLTITTLADVDPELELHAYCKACQRMEKLDKATLALEMGPDVELERIRAGLRCGACGGRDALLYRIWEGAGEFKYGDG